MFDVNPLGPRMHLKEIEREVLAVRAAGATGRCGNWTSVLAAELLKTSRVRGIKQARFQRGLMMAILSFIVLGGDQLLRIAQRVSSRSLQFGSN